MDCWVSLIFTQRSDGSFEGGLWITRRDDDSGEPITEPGTLLVPESYAD